MDLSKLVIMPELDEWFYVYIQAYIYAIQHPDDPARWHFCDAVLQARRKSEKVAF